MSSLRNFFEILWVHFVVFLNELIGSALPVIDFLPQLFFLSDQSLFLCIELLVPGL